MNLCLKTIRKENGISQADLAKRLSVDIKTVGNWERGKTIPDAEQVWNCAVVLGCSPNDICGWYIDHPDDRPAPPGDSGAEELVGCYSRCTSDRRASLLQAARDAALASGEATERADVQEAV